MVEKAEIPMRVPRKSNGNGNVVADNGGEQPAIGGGKQPSAGQPAKDKLNG